VEEPLSEDEVPSEDEESDDPPPRQTVKNPKQSAVTKIVVFMASSDTAFVVAAT
jgi:hypothetical protein